jgi:hypothetical protein
VRANASAPRALEVRHLGNGRMSLTMARLPSGLPDETTSANTFLPVRRVSLSGYRLRRRARRAPPRYSQSAASEREATARNATKLRSARNGELQLDGGTELLRRDQPRAVDRESVAGTSGGRPDSA